MVSLDQPDEVSRRIAGEGGLRKMRVRGEKIFWLTIQVGEVTAPPARDENLFPHAIGAFEDNDAATSLACLDGAHQAGRSRAQHNRVEFLHH